MWAEAILAKDDLEQVTAQLFPLRINIGQDGSVLLTDRRALALLPEVGLRMTVSAEIHWPVLGVHVPVSVRSATLEIRPEILESGTLALKLHLDDVDVSMLLGFVDRGIVDLVNKELEAKHIELSWGFTKTLSHVFDLPEALASAGALDLCAVSGRIKITSDALALAVLFRARVEARGAVGPAVAASPVAIERPPAVPHASPRPGIRRMLGRSPGVTALVTGLGMLIGAGLFAVFASGR